MKKNLMITGAMVAAFMLTGCANTEEPVTQSEPAMAYEAAAAQPNPNNTAERSPAAVIEGDFAVATVNGANIYASDIGFQIRAASEQLMWEYIMTFGEFEIDYDRDFRDGLTYGQYLRRTAVRQAAYGKIITTYGANLGIYLPQEMIDMIEEDIASIEGEHTAEEFRQMLDDSRIVDRNHLARVFEAEDMANLVIYTIFSDDDMFAAFEQYMQPDLSEGAEELAASLLERAQAGEDFSSLVATYGQDPGMVSYPEGYTFIGGVMVAEFEQATMALQIGEISGLVPTGFGIHIIKRVEPNMDNIMGAMPGDEFTEDEVLAAKHILISTESIPEDQRRFEAITGGFSSMMASAEIVFLDALDDVEL